MEVGVLLQNQLPWPPTFCARLPSVSAHAPLRGGGCGAAGTPRWGVRGGLVGGRRTAARRRRRQRWLEEGVVETEEEPPGLWEEFLDSMWFLKALGSYGWFLPLIMLSMLLASGAKAFLISFSILLGLSILTFVAKKLLQWIQTTTFYKTFVAQKPPSARAVKDAQELANGNGSESSIGAPSFGGWEDLIDEREVWTRRAQRPIERKTSLGERMAELKRRVEGEREMPLLLRFLVAVFPFLSDWTELL